MKKFNAENHFERLADDHQNARLLAEGLNQIDTFDVDMKLVQTNIIIADTILERSSADEIVTQMKKNGILTIPFGPHKIRFVTHLNISRDDVEFCVDTLTHLYK